ncbi:hypothetical protein GCM10008956_39060 [Deinococcus arenae]|uniref:Uncharacterized protein n=1 Tax=Deinococcus arenae TaxID=1452751 RepID=A0A8H9LAJ8_9DEIO|nr:hypothetical protein [Deinococcus arenae]GGM59586.1 hypothetical protein GCM10008956_39060 [Deinococcus arenae]
MLLLPPARFQDLRAAIRREDAARRYWAMVETDEFGVKAEWVGKGKPPKSDWKYDASVRQAYMDQLRTEAGLAGPTPDQQDPITLGNQEWAALRQRRRQRAGLG